MACSQKIKLLRTEKEWTQNDLARKLNVHREQVSSYERSLSLPTTEVLMKIAKLFKVSTDYLLFDDNAERPIHPKIRDVELLRQFEELDFGVSEKDSRLVKDLIENMLWKNRLQKIAAAG